MIVVLHLPEMIIYTAIRKHHAKRTRGEKRPPAIRRMGEAQSSNEEPPTKICRTDAGQSTSSRLETFTCCNRILTANQMNSHRRTLEHKTNSCVHLADGVHLIRSAFKCRIVSYRLHGDNFHIDYTIFFNEVKHKALKLLEDVLKSHKIIKVNMEIFGKYVLPTQDSSDIKSFNTPNKLLDRSMDLDLMWNTFVDLMMTQTTEFQERDSGWALEQILYLEMNINKYSPMGGSSYIPSPKFVEKKRAVVNVRNRDQCCFAWAVTSALYVPAGQCTEISSYPHFSSVLNMTGINFPVKLRDISKFEELNNISVNVYGLENKFEDNKITYEIVGPLRYSQKKLHVHVNLLLLSEECVENHQCNIDCGKFHYCWIQDLSRLVSSQISATEHKKYFCDGCLLYFHNERFLLQHQRNDCNHICTTTPSTQFRIDKYGKEVPENILKFENFERQMLVPFVVYADFDVLLIILYHNLYRGADAAKVFVSTIESDLKEIYNKYLKDEVPMSVLTLEEKQKFRDATVCGICDKIFEDDDVKVRDHCHLTGKVRSGAAYSICNLNYKLPKYIPIVFHNMSGYDCHLFIKELCTPGVKVDVLAQNKEKIYIFY
ncbi:hypothetical protein NQ317_001085 [Molorchus minor]|uniref:DNA-directed DNA polymerase n=1 Tax=Molorchus minor TaxID=1323400 RepID=A0ABQ9JN57_9CUCU|nr:hypothetical protein NQ317_001085 [Molorchus minor]